MPESAQSHSDHELEVQSTDQANYPYIKMRGNLYWNGSAWTKWEGAVTLPSTTSTAINDGTTPADKAKVADGRSSYGKGLYVLPGNYFASRTALTDGQQDFLKLDSAGDLQVDVNNTVTAVIPTNNLDGTSTHGTRDLVSANTWYAVPSTVPTAAYILIAQPRAGNAGTIRWSFLNSGTPAAGTGLEIQGNLILRLAANESVVFASTSSGDDVDWTAKEIV